jgi:hypothetical protein
MPRKGAAQLWPEKVLGIARFYRYYFHRVYEWQSGRESRNDAVQTALGCVVLTVHFNVLLIISLLLQLFGLAEETLRPISSGKARIIGVLLVLPLFLFFYFIWIRNERYVAFHDEFAGESLSRRRLGKIKIVLYVFLSVAVPLTLAAAHGLAI